MRSKLCLILPALLMIAGIATAYTNLWQPVYYDRTLMGGGSATTATVFQVSGVYNTPSGFGVYMDTVHIAAHKESLVVALDGSVVDPYIWSLNGTIQVGIAIPRSATNSSYLTYITANDSTAIQIPGKLRSFVIWKYGSTDSAAANGYVVMGKAAIPAARMISVNQGP